MEFGDFAYGLVVKVLGRRGLVEVEIASEDLVRSLSRENHLDTHRLDYAGEQIHRSRCPDGRHVVGLDVVDHIPDGIQALLDGEIHLVMDSADVVCDLFCLGKVRSTLQPDRKGVESRPPGV